MKPTVCRRRLETISLVEKDHSTRTVEAQLLEELNASLHELSQPITVLLCSLEYGISVDSLEEMKLVLTALQEASGRAQRTMQAMQEQVRRAIKESKTREEQVARTNAEEVRGGEFGQRNFQGPVLL